LLVVSQDTSMPVPDTKFKAPVFVALPNFSEPPTWIGLQVFEGVAQVPSPLKKQLRWADVAAGTSPAVALAADVAPT